VDGPDLSDYFETEDYSGDFNGFLELTTSPNASVFLTVEKEFVCEKQVGEVTDLQWSAIFFVDRVKSNFNITFRSLSRFLPYKMASILFFGVFV